MSHQDWREEAVYWRFLAGDGVAAIAEHWDIGLEQVEDLVRQRIKLGVGALITPGVLVDDQPAPRVARRPKRATKAAAVAVAKRRRRPRAETTDWQARALEGLRGAPHAVAISELITRLRLPDDQRRVASRRFWSALQALVARGDVNRTGTRYSLTRKEVA